MHDFFAMASMSNIMCWSFYFLLLYIFTWGSLIWFKFDNENISFLNDQFYLDDTM